VKGEKKLTEEEELVTATHALGTNPEE